MKTSEGFIEKSYRRHAEHFHQYSKSGEKHEHAKTWFKNETVDAWRHRRLYRIIDPILKREPDAKWLTVGDGRYGKDARYIIDQGGIALATDISDVLLKEAKASGYISDFKTENAEFLSFKDGEFDYVLCKETYHHLPRPMMGLYEMLRVAGKGVVLIEPCDEYISNHCIEVLFRNIKKLVRKLYKGNGSRHQFEESGNFAYKISKREMEKAALGLNLKIVAFKGINDAYLTGVEYEKLSDKGPLQRRIRLMISVADFLFRLKMMVPGMLIVIFFKTTPEKDLLEDIKRIGFEIVKLPPNPYLSG
jgi:ubiquinone/menaquinone biosynthesis C-methylase UbiE